MKTCKWCENKFEDRKHPNKNFCTRKCFAKSREMFVKYTCRFCRKEFIRRSIGRTYKFCSFSCRAKAQADPSKKKIFICNYCGKEFVGWAYRNMKYCSKQCNNVVQAHLPKPGNRNPNLYIVKPCAFCGKLHRFNTHQIRLRGGKYCSKDCMNKAMSIAKRGKGNPNYTGVAKGSYYRGPNWHSQARKARRRDNCTCQNCGEKWEKSQNKRTDVHHIIPYRKFKKSDWLKANDLSNLIVLCRNCHRKVECGKIPCPKIKS